LGDLNDRNIAILGLSFKPDTDDMREAPSIYVIEGLLKKGAKIKGYDPIALENAKKVITGIEFSESVEDCVKEADLLIIMTEWNEFRQLDLNMVKELMRGNFLIDGRNIFTHHEAKKAGFEYIGVGR